MRMRGIDDSEQALIHQALADRIDALARVQVEDQKVEMRNGVGLPDAVYHGALQQARAIFESFLVHGDPSNRS